MQKFVRKLRRHHPHSEGYWPGYVDALTNIVLNLLFLVAVLAAGVFSLGMQASRNAQNMVEAMETVQLEEVPEVPSPAPEVPQLPPLSAVPGLGQESQPLRQEREALVIDAGVQSGAQKRTNNLEPEVWVQDAQEQDSHALLRVRFKGEVVRVSEADSASLVERLRALRARYPQASVVVWAVSDADPGNRRATFLRVMAIRDQLPAVGVEMQQVLTRIIPGSSALKQGQEVYVLFNLMGNENAGNRQ